MREYERGVIFRLGRLIAQKGPGLIIPDPGDRPQGPGHKLLTAMIVIGKAGPDRLSNRPRQRLEYA